MKKGIEILLLSFAMGIVATSGTFTSNNGRKGMAKADAIIKNEDIDYSNLEVPNATLLPGKIQIVDATYTGMEHFGPETHFNRHDYFANLKAYSPNNNIGSCGYVSLSQLMMFYDTFYNDDIVPEQYEVKKMDAKTEAEVNAQSPGLKKQSYYSSGYSNYYEYCHANESNDLDCKLTVIRNQLDGTDTPDKFTYSIGGWNYQTMLNNFYGSSDVVNFTYTMSLTQAGYIQYIKDSIDAGDPVIVHIKHSSGASGAHSVVAYDYDSTKIYTHYGWGDYSSTYDLLQSYDQIYFVGKLNYSALGHKCSDNYVINNVGHCGCNITNEIHAATTAEGKHIIYWANDGKSTGGTITLNALFRRIIDDSFLRRTDLLLEREEKVLSIDDSFIPAREEALLIDDDFKDFRATRVIDDVDMINSYLDRQELNFVDENLVKIDTDLVIRLKTTMYVLESTSNAVEIPDTIFNKFFSLIKSSPVTFKRLSTIDYKPTTKVLGLADFLNRYLTLTTEDYAFGNVYASTATTKVIEKDGVAITTKRLRCGSIYDSSITHNTYTTISAKRSGFGTAYLEYNMGYAVKSIEIDLAMWSSSESLTANNGTATIQYLDSNGNWVVAKDLLRDVTLSTNKDSMTKVAVTFGESATAFRVHSTVNSATGSSNKGRICIGDLTVCY